MSEKRTYQKSPLTNSQEKLLLEEIEKAVRVMGYREHYGSDKNTPAAVIRAEETIRRYQQQRDKARAARRASIESAHQVARKAVIFAESKDAAQKAVGDLRARLTRIVEGAK